MGVYYITDTEVELVAQERLLAGFPAARREKLARISAPQQKWLSTLGYALFEYAALKETGAVPEISYTETGKPVLAAGAVSWSHCPAGVACVYEAGAYGVGIDMESVRDCSSQVARRVCTDAEYAELMALEPADRDRGFIRMWTVKEAYAKLTGRGFAEGFHQIESAKLHAVVKEFPQSHEQTKNGKPGLPFYIALCVEREEGVLVRSEADFTRVSVAELVRFFQRCSH